ncbi:MAG: flavin reductase [Ekhidna sp.]|nr:flavin reductase [Ekhidna sp.]
MPIYSLATYHGSKVNMNICTYVTAVSMKPKLFMIAVDYNTQTFQNLRSENRAVLQILHSDQQNLIQLLGKKSGKVVDKQAKLEDRDLLTSWKGNRVLKESCGYLQLRTIKRSNIGGDHEIFYFEVETSTTKNEAGVLMFQKLIADGVIL